MTRINLYVYLDPGEVQVFCNLRRSDGQQEKILATVDTGAAVSLLPRELLDVIDHRPTQRDEIMIDQAGIAGAIFLRQRSLCHPFTRRCRR